MKWSNKHKLTINCDKTKTVFYGVKRKLKGTEELTFNLNGQIIETTDSYKYLGMDLDATLNFDKHINSTISKVSHKLWILGRIRKYGTTKMAVKIYKSHVTPYFDYCDVIYMGGSTVKLEKLQRLQNRGLKTCLRLDPRFSTCQLHRLCKISTLSARRDCRLNTYAYRKSCKDENCELQRRITRTSCAPILKKVRAKCAAYEKSTAYRAATQWNKLSTHTRNIKTLTEFKTYQKHQLSLTWK